MTKYTKVRNPQWIDESREKIICSVYFEHLGEEVEFVADPNDVELHGREIFHRCVSGEFGELSMAPLERIGGLLRVADILPQAEDISDMPERERGDLEELQRYLEDANSENATGTERGVVLVWASIIDDVLAGVLESFFVEDRAAVKGILQDTGELATFGSRIKAAYLLGLISKDEKVFCQSVKKIRNDFAHKIGITLSDEKYRQWCKTLYNGLVGDGANPEPRHQFSGSCGRLLVILGNRKEKARNAQRAILLDETPAHRRFIR